MKYIKLMAIFFLGAVLMNACRKDVTVPQASVQMITSNVSFDTVVLPIFTANCAKANCHASGANSPDLSSAAAYNSLTGLGYVPQDDTSDADAKSSILYKMITSTTKPMPPTSPLTSTQLSQILSWIKQGSQNN